jgi:hypothetical protein
MSGGTWENSEYNILNIADGIQNEVDKNEHREDVKMKMLEAIDMLKMAYVYARAIDYYLSGDIGEDTLIKRIDTEIEKL